VGVVTCLVTDAASGPAAARLELEGAAAIVDDGSRLTAAFRRVTDALRAAIAIRSSLPSGARIALCAGETRGGEFSAVADKAARLADTAAPGATVLSRLAGVLAIDHLPRDRRLSARCAGESYELVAAVAQPA
jgi:hypothetical protein